MNRALALLAGLLLASQVVTTPVAAADASAIGTTVLAESERKPASPKPGNVFSDVLRPDLKAEFVSGSWNLSNRHSKFKITNVGKVTAKNPKYWQQTWTFERVNFQEDSTESWAPLADLAPGESTIVEVVGKPKHGWICTLNRVHAFVTEDNVDTNNAAMDDVYSIRAMACANTTGQRRHHASSTRTSHRGAAGHPGRHGSGRGGRAPLGARD